MSERNNQEVRYDSLDLVIQRGLSYAGVYALCRYNIDLAKMFIKEKKIRLAEKFLRVAFSYYNDLVKIMNDWVTLRRNEN